MHFGRLATIRLQPHLGRAVTSGVPGRVAHTRLCLHAAPPTAMPPTLNVRPGTMWLERMAARTWRFCTVGWSVACSAPDLTWLGARPCMPSLGCPLRLSAPHNLPTSAGSHPPEAAGPWMRRHRAGCAQRHRCWAQTRWPPGRGRPAWLHGVTKQGGKHPR